MLIIVLVLTSYNTWMLHDQSERNGVEPTQYALTSNVTPRERTMPIVAVANDGTGVIETLDVRITPGNNNVLISTNPFLEPGLQYSMNKAVTVAKEHTGTGYEHDYVFEFKSRQAELLGGESAGAAATIATIAALQGDTINDNVAITGTITADGRVGRIGGVLEKAKAVANAGYETFLIPEGQADLVYYEREVSERPSGFGFTIRDTRFVPKRVDLKDVAKEWGLNVVEVATIDDALPYFINS
jgi:uncharacterized protein